MQEVFSKIIEKLNSKKVYFQRFYECEGKSEHDADLNKSTQLAFDDAIEIVKQEAEKYNNGWIPCSERLPETSGEYLTWVKYDGKEFHSIDEIDCDGIFKEWNCSSDYKIIAWMNLPAPYQPKGE